MSEQFFIRYFRSAPWLSFLFLLVGLLLYWVRGLPLGVDFQAGLELQVAYEGNSVTQKDLEEVFLSSGWTYRIQSLSGSGVDEGKDLFNLRLAPQEAGLSDSTSQAGQESSIGQEESSSSAAMVLEPAFERVVVQFLRDETPDFDILRSNYVSPAFSHSLISQTFLYISLALLFIFLYILARFRWNYAVAAILTLFHDVLMVMSFCVLLGVELNTVTIAALLTIIGYSLNDTLVVFDRVRYNMKLHTGSPLYTLLVLSLKEVFSRTLITSLTTFLSVSALFLFSTGAVKSFAFIMLFGVLMGTHSSIGIAIPCLQGLLRSPSKKTTLKLMS